MQRLISLFREPEDGYARRQPADDPPEPLGYGEPLYFQELLKYLRLRKQTQIEKSEPVCAGRN